MLMVLAFTTVSAVLGKSTLRGMTALASAWRSGLIGIDQISGQARYTGGVPELIDGIEVVLIAVGLFAVGEALYMVALRRPDRRDAEHDEQGAHDRAPSGGARGRPGCARTAIGFPFGTIPAGGSEIPTFLSYAAEKKLSKHKEEFGTTGAIEGVAGPEAANNAAITATLIPLLTLGIPTSNTTAILLGAFQNYGIQPGPQLFDTNVGAGLGADRVALHRQRDAAGAEPAAGRAVGQAAEDPEAAALRRHPDLRDRRRLRHAPVGVRPGPALRASACSASSCGASTSRPRRSSSA